MEHGNDQNTLWFNAIQHRVGESAHERAANVRENYAIQCRPFSDAGEHLLHSVSEGDTEARTLPLIPIERFIKVNARFPPQDNRERQRRARARACEWTSSQVTVSSGDCA